MGDEVANVSFPLRCECGTVNGSLQVRGLAVHGVCYCRDCQAFARFLGKPERVLDSAGATEVIGTLPYRLQFTSGQDRLACITLTPTGPYRWYAECCRTAIGNTSRARKIPFVTLHARALAVPAEVLEQAFGPRAFAFAAESATTPVTKPRLGMLLTLPRILWNVVYARVSGVWRTNPFFEPGTDTPLRAPQALSKEQRQALRGETPPRA